MAVLFLHVAPGLQLQLYWLTGSLRGYSLQLAPAPEERDSVDCTPHVISTPQVVNATFCTSQTPRRTAMTLWGYARTEPTVLVAWPSIVLFSHALRWLAGRHARWHLRDKQCYGLPVAVRFWFGLGLAFSCL